MNDSQIAEINFWPKFASLPNTIYVKALKEGTQQNPRQKGLCR